MIEYLNMDNKSVNDTLTAELERYKDQVRILKEGQNVDLKSKDNVSDSCAQSKAQQLEPKLYDGNVTEKTNVIVICDSEETLMLVEERHSKMLLKQKDPMMSEKKDNTTPVDYAVLNQLSQDFETRFVPQTELSPEQAFWSQNSMNSPEPTPSNRPTKVEEKDMVIKKLKERIISLSGNIKEDKIKKELEEIETINIELDHRVTNLIAKNEHLKQTYKVTITILSKVVDPTLGNNKWYPPEEACKGPASESFTKKKGMTIVITTENIQKRRNDVKARTILLLALPNEHQLRFNKDDLDTMSLDDVYNHLKVYEPEVQKKSESNSQNMGFISSSNISSGKAASLSHDTVCTYIASQSNGSQIKYEDITQIDEYDIKEMDIKWNMALLSMRADREFRAPRSQDREKRENYKQGPKEEELAPKALMAIDGIGWD
nr:hypothetical protein [Tanacetum cinerariifolium]